MKMNHNGHKKKQKLHECSTNEIDNENDSRKGNIWEQNIIIKRKGERRNK